jgi:predicted acetyltransferase
MSGVKPRRLQKGEEEAFLQLMYAAFGFQAHFARYLEFDEALDVEDTWVIESEERIVAGVQIFSRPISIRGQRLWLGGIGSVATHPEYEGRGLATRLLRTALDDMQERGMALSLLFTSRVSFYERLDWVQVPYRVWACRQARPLGDPSQRSMRRTDLPCLMDLYASYTSGMDGVTVRDEAYWRGQLRFAGNPEEDFRVMEREGEPVAYARSILLEGRTRIMEFARAEDAAEELARLLASMAPAGETLFIPDAGDPELLAATRQYFAECRPVEGSDQMWRVLDRPRLEALMDARPDRSDRTLLAQIVGADRYLFWPSDRF